MNQLQGVDRRFSSQTTSLDISGQAGMQAAQGHIAEVCAGLIAVWTDLKSAEEGARVAMGKASSDPKEEYKVIHMHPGC